MNEAGKITGQSVSEFILSYEDQLMTRIDKAYKAADEREVISEVIFPQLVCVLGKALREFEDENELTTTPDLSADELGLLCKKIDSTLADNRELLFLDSYFKEGLEIVSFLRIEISVIIGEMRAKRTHQALAANGIRSRAGLLGVSRNALKRMDFEPYGRIKAVLSAHLGSGERSVSRDAIEELAAKVYPEANDMDGYRAILASKGITTHQGFIGLGRKGFLISEFPPVGKALRFAGKVLGRRIDNVTNDVLQEISTALALPMDPNTEATEVIENRNKDLCREAFASAGITTRKDLLRWKMKYLKSQKFGSLGGIRVIASMLLGKKKRNSVSSNEIVEIADILFPEDEQE